MAIMFDEIKEPEYSPLEYVIHLGARGNHVLFDNDRIREAFKKEEEEITCLGSEFAEEIREAIRNVLSIPEVESKRDYISSLPGEIQDVLIFLYFQMIENTITINQSSHH